MKKFEYKTIAIPLFKKEDPFINLQANNGWRLVAVSSAILYFEREVPAQHGAEATGNELEILPWDRPL
jgi:hypothetical protein